MFKKFKSYLLEEAALGKKEEFKSQVIVRKTCKLSSGLYSNRYIEINRLFHSVDLRKKYTDYFKAFVKMNVDDLKEVDWVVGVPSGGIVLGYEVARYLDKPFLVLEKKGDKFSVGDCEVYALKKDQKVILIDDVLSTGDSIRKAALALKDLGLTAKWAFTLVDRKVENSIVCEAIPDEVIRDEMGIEIFKSFYQIPLPVVIDENRVQATKTRVK